MVAETVSVILQVGAYKLWKRRIFKMAPLHHHFELLGFSELEVVLMFWLAAVVLGVVGYLLA
jgi:phospho-N-acetylmuramoyl-pentapeptide-transferase